MTTCPECNDTGERDSGGTTPWGEPVYLPCDCKDAEIGRRWREDSSLEKWFPLTAEELERLRADNAALRREAHSWWTAARDALKLREPLAPEAIEAAAAEAFGYEGGLQEVNLGDLLHFARVLEQRHGIGA